MKSLTRTLATTVGALVVAASAGFVSTPAEAVTYDNCTGSRAFFRDVGHAQYSIDLPTVRSGALYDPVCQMGTWMSGTSYASVRTLQNALNACYAQGLVVDGKFGTKTRQALVRVQQHEGIGADGVYGPRTMRAMDWPQYSAGAGKGCAAGGYYW